MHRVRVLVVDRQADHAETLRLLLESRGCVVLMARDAHTALALVAAYRPDALVVELDILGVGGVCAAARAANPLGVCVLGLPGRGVDACDCCCDLRLQKPYRFEDVVACIDRFIEERARQKRAAGGDTIG